MTPNYLLSLYVGSLFVPLVMALMTTTATTTTMRLGSGPHIAALAEQREELKNRLPPVDPEKMSKIEIEFRELLEGILYTSTEMEAIANPRIRSVYQGISASYYERDVYRAFEVLYEDYMPLRVAGRMVYGRLNQVMEESNVYRQSQLEELTGATKLSPPTLLRCWSSFIRLAEDKELSSEKFGNVERRALEIAKSEGNDELQLTLNPSGKETLTFSESMMELIKFSEMAGIDPESFVGEVWHQDWREPSTLQLDSKRAKYNRQYDEMIEKFTEWKAFIPDGEGRRLDILKGCFVGSENEAVVEALRVIYTDNTALRMSGNWIFKVVSTIMKSTMRRRRKMVIKE
jgi:hypothetical protein